MLSHFSFNNFIPIAFPDIARDLDLPIYISDISSFSGQSLLTILLLIVFVAHAPPVMVLFFLFLFLPLTFAFVLTAVAVLCKPGYAVSAADTSSV